KNLKVDTVIEQEQIDPIFITSEIQVLQSRSLMEQTLQSLNMFEMPENIENFRLPISDVLLYNLIDFRSKTESHPGIPYS
ncbi:MAG: hypothetical protein SFU99_14535, partial [Saprospiraceae bacterium]|nr:hypothetical protein [Saprospiraceae bacterium]